MTGKALEDAMQKQPWDPSVKALDRGAADAAMMNDQLKWTQNLGDAFLAQQADVLDAVQTLRARADAAGNLKSRRSRRSRAPIGRQTFPPQRRAGDGVHDRAGQSR